MASDETSSSDIRVFTESENGPKLEITDTIITFPAFEQRTLAGKGALANTLSCHLHSFLQDNGVGTHFIEQIGKQEQAIVETEQIPFDLVLRNLALDDMSREFGLEPSYRFNEPLLEFFVRPDTSNGHPVRVSDRHLVALQIASIDELGLVQDIALRINDLLTGAFFGVGVMLAEIRFEFGVYYAPEDGTPTLLVISEFSPDTMKLIDTKTSDALDVRCAFDGARDPLRGYKAITRRFDLDAPKKVVKRAAKSTSKTSAKTS
ncbi:MAG: phosphoribosylaminoimidazolesuccinocarboxamide synthase [Pseudomonadota bacterium]